MSSEESKMLELCPLCGTELGFIHISFEEDIKICMNEDCVYPFKPGVVYEFRPSKKITKDFCYSEEYMETLMRKVESEFQELGLDWDTYNANELLSNMHMPLNEACELDDMDAYTPEKDVDVGDTNSLNLDEFLDSLSATPKSSASAVVYEDPSNTKVIQPGTDHCDDEANRLAAYENSLKSVMSELEEALETVNIGSQMDNQWDADDFYRQTFETNKSRVVPGGLETVAAVKQASPQVNYVPKKPNITTFSNASMNRKMRFITGSRETTCAQTGCTSEKSSDNAKKYTDRLNYLFAENNFDKFEFPEFLKTDHNISKEMPKRHSETVKNKEFDSADHNLLNEMPKRHSEPVKHKKFDSANHNLLNKMPKRQSKPVKPKEFDSPDHNLLHEMPKRHSKPERHKEFDSTDHNLSNEMPKSHSEPVKNKQFDSADHNLLHEMPKRLSERIKNKKFDNTDHSLLNEMPKRHSEPVKNQQFDSADHSLLHSMPKRYSERIKNKQFNNADHNSLKEMPTRYSERLKNKNKDKMDQEFDNSDHNESKPRWHRRQKNKNKIVASRLTKMP